MKGHIVAGLRDYDMNILGEEHYSFDHNSSHMGLAAENDRLDFPGRKGD